MLRSTLLLLLLAGFSVGGCDSCTPQEVETPVVVPETEPEPEPEPVDPLKEAKEGAEKAGESNAVTVGDQARIVAGEVEALMNQPTKPVVKRPISDPETGKIDVREVKRIFGQSDLAMRKCYERSLKANPGLEGKVALEVVIRSDGSVGYAKAKGVSLSDAQVFECMERQASSIKFPPPTGGSVRVNNPYTFTPDF